MNKFELLLGFDAREMWYYKDVEAMGRRTAGGIGFLRDEVKKGLSIDSSIWGSVFDSGDYPTLAGEERRRIGLGTVKLPDWIGPNNPLWENLSELERHLSRSNSEIVKPYWIIAITRISQEKEVGRFSSEWPHFEPTTPRSVLPEWKSVGYDIADKGGEACLTGTEFRGEKQYLERLCRSWGPLLNEYHLFRDIEHAMQFKEAMTEQQDSSRRPCFVYGIWLIKEVAE